MSKIGFRTRKRGTPNQIGKKFPVLEKRKLPKFTASQLKKMHEGLWLRESAKRKEPLYEKARTELDIETDELASDPQGYIGSLGWEIKLSPEEIAKIKREIDFTTEDIDNVHDSELHRRQGQFTYLPLHDAAVNIVAEKITKILGKKRLSRRKPRKAPKVTPESERASEWYARRYPMMFRGGGKIKTKYWVHGKSHAWHGGMVWFGPWDSEKEALKHAHADDTIIPRKEGWEPPE